MKNSMPMPRTWNAIKAAFPGANNKGLREKIFNVAQPGNLGQAGDVRLLVHTVGFSNPQLAAQYLEEIQAVAESERK